MMGQTFSPDSVIDQAMFGQRAAHVKAVVSGRLSQHEDRILSAALTNFRAGLLTAEQARDAIAQISALRDLTHAIDKEMSKGIEARQSLVASPGLSRGQRQGGSR